MDVLRPARILKIQRVKTEDVCWKIGTESTIIKDAEIVNTEQICIQNVGKSTAKSTLVIKEANMTKEVSRKYKKP